MLQYSRNNLYLLTFYAIFFSFLYLFVEFLSQIIFQSTILGNDVLNPTRYIISSFYHEEIYSSYVVRIFPLFVGLFFLNKKKLRPFFKFGFFFLSSALIIIVIKNGERSAIGLLLLILFYFLFFIDIELKIKIKIILVLSLLVPILYLNLSENSAKRKLEGFLSAKLTLENILNNKNEKKIFFSEKYNSLYRTSINIYKEYPVIGSGVKNFRIICSNKKFAFDERSCSTHPHNLLLQILAETGTSGLLYYLSILIILTKLLFKNLKQKFLPLENKNYFTCLVGSTFISLWPFFPSGNFFNNWLSIVMFFPIGFLLKEVYFKKKQ